MVFDDRGVHLDADLLADLANLELHVLRNRRGRVERDVVRHGNLKTGCADADLVGPDGKRGHQVIADVVGLRVPLLARALVLHHDLGMGNGRTKGVGHRALENRGGLPESEISESN